MNVSLNFFLIPRYGINGAAFSTMMGYLLMALSSTYYLKKNLKISKLNFPLFEGVIIGIVLLLFTNYLKQNLILTGTALDQVIVLTILGISYVILLFLTRVVNIREIKSILRLYLKWKVFK